MASSLRSYPPRPYDTTALPSILSSDTVRTSPLPLLPASPACDAVRVEVVSPGPARTRAIGEAIGTVAAAGYVVLLNGPLGAGKTCLTQGILRGLGSDEHARSPTFVLVAEYEARLTLYHVDLYRMSGASDVEDIGIEEYLWGGGVCVIEWAEKAWELYPPERLQVELSPLDEKSRRIVVTAHGCRYLEALSAARAAAAHRPRWNCR